MINGVIVETSSAISDKESASIANVLLVDEEHSEIEDHLDIKDPGMEAEIGCISALRSIAKSVLHTHHPISKRYEDWDDLGIKLFRGEPKNGIRFAHGYEKNEKTSQNNLCPLSFAYVPLIGGIALNKIPDPEPGLKALILPGEAAILSPHLTNYSIIVEPHSVLMRLAFI